MLLLPMKLPIVIPMTVEAYRPQVEHGLRPGFRPTHAGLLHAILHQLPTSPCDAPRANRPAPCQVLVIVPIRAVTLVVAKRAPYGLPWCRRAPGVFRLRLQRRDNGV